MGKRQHQKDKLYLTCTEWSNVYGGRRPEADSNNEINRKFRRQTFDQCSLTFTPFTHPYCNSDGYIFDLANIVPFLKKYGVDPINGKKIDAKSLIKLNFSKDDEGNYQCPVLRRKFTENSHIVAVKPTGNVYSYEAVEQLNLKVKNFRDLLTDEPFIKSDLITIQEPLDTEKRNISNFHHIKNKLKFSLDEDEAEESSNSKQVKLKTVDQITKATLDEMSKNDLFTKKTSTSESKTAEEIANDKNKKLITKQINEKFNKATYSTGTVAASLTSTVMNVETTVEPALFTDEEILLKNVKGKGYLQIATSEGMLNIELFCSHVPKACYNFIQLSKKGYYDNTIFHRLIKNFMVQGGDPTGTGHGGDSIWNKPFEDEIRSTLGHNERGVLSMANSGKNTNKSQFFITLRSCKHLNGKHTIFGKVVGGLDTLNKIESIKTDEKDKPLNEIKIINIKIFIDPFQNLLDEINKERQRLFDEEGINEGEEEEGEKQVREKSDKSKSNKEKINFKNQIKYKDGIGSFINPSLFNDDQKISSSLSTPLSASTAILPKDKKTKGRSAFGDFSSW